MTHQESTQVYHYVKRESQTQARGTVNVPQSTADCPTTTAIGHNYFVLLRSARAQAHSTPLSMGEC